MFPARHQGLTSASQHRLSVTHSNPLSSPVRKALLKTRSQQQQDQHAALDAAGHAPMQTTTTTNIQMSQLDI